MGDTIYYSVWDAVFVAGFAAGALLFGLLGNKPFDVDAGNLVPVFFNALIMAMWLGAVIVVGGNLFAAGAFDNAYRTFSLVSFSMSAYAAMWLFGYNFSEQAKALTGFGIGRMVDESWGIGLSAFLYFCGQAAVNIWLAASDGQALQGYNVMAWLANPAFIVVLAWFASMTEETPGFDEKVLQADGWVASVPMNYALILSWTAIMAEAGLRFFLDAPRFGTFVVLTLFLPLYLAATGDESSGRRATHFFHFHVLCSAAFWISFFAFPIFSSGTMLYTNNPDIFFLSTWGPTTQSDVLASHYFFSTAALASVIIAAVELAWQGPQKQAAQGILLAPRRSLRSKSARVKNEA